MAVASEISDGFEITDKSKIYWYLDVSINTFKYQSHTLAQATFCNSLVETYSIGESTAENTPIIYSFHSDLLGHCTGPIVKESNFH